MVAYMNGVGRLVGSALAPRSQAFWLGVGAFCALTSVGDNFFLFWLLGCCVGVLARRLSRSCSLPGQRSVAR
eukprot:scaffold5013_cov83-Isochrysis_galbana.AAC.1